MEFRRNKYLKQLKKHRGVPAVKIIAGARRVGKSYLMNVIFYEDLVKEGFPPERIIKFAFDSDDDIDRLDSFFPEEPTKSWKKKDFFVVNSKKFRAFIREKTQQEGPYILLLDEIQVLENFVETLNGFLNRPELDVYVSGSNSEMLSSDISTRFKGRRAEIRVLPLSFSEYIQGTGKTPEEAWRDYIVTGGIPMVYAFPDSESRANYLSSLAEEVYLKDIIERYDIKLDAEIKELYQVLASSIGGSVSPSKLQRTFQSKKGRSPTDDTIRRFIDYFENAFVISETKQYDVRGRKYIESPTKIYFSDIGVRNAILGFRQIEETHIMENVIYNELLYRGYQVNCGRLELFENTGKGYVRKETEIDFVANKNDERIYVQSCLNIEESETRKRELRPLEKIKDSFPKIVVSKSGLAKTVTDSGIILYDLFDFLMQSA